LYISKYQRFKNFSDTHFFLKWYFKGRQLERVLETLMDVLIQEEAGFRVLNISYQLPTAALLFPLSSSL